MLIDWYTVGAQALNFIILVWLLKRFLYKPILSAINAREKKITSEIANADAKKTEAQKEHDEFKKKNEEFDQKRTELMTKATEEAGNERDRLIQDARKAADLLSAKRAEVLKTDAAHLKASIRSRTEREVFDIARKALSDLSTGNLEKSICDAFTRRLKEMPAGPKKELADAFMAGPEPAVLRSHSDLPEDQRAEIQKALNESFSTDVRVRYEVTPALLGGIELTAHGKKVAWSISDYLGSMEKSLLDSP
jgi:F-type H+-transporting ATPase subunit b